MKTIRAVLLHFPLLLIGCEAHPGWSFWRNESPSPRPSAVTAAEESATPIGRFLSLLPEVNFHRSSDQIWQSAVPETLLFPFDVIRTRAQASAQIRLRNGSELDVGENSLVVLNPDFLAQNRSVDRAVVRDGTVKGVTASELWILTSAALFKMRPKGPGKTGRITIALHKGTRLRARVHEGETVVIPVVSASTGKPVQPLTIATEKEIELPAPAVSEDFGEKREETTWKTLAQVPTPIPMVPSPVPPAATAQAPVPVRHAKAQPLDFVITSPGNHAELDAELVKLEGHVSGEGGLLLVNGKSANRTSPSEFSVEVHLQPGINSILVQLVRPGGDSVFHRWTLIRKFSLLKSASGSR
jgi:hypothetical protein